MRTDSKYTVNDNQALREIDRDIHEQEHYHTLLLTDGWSQGTSPSQCAGHDQVSNLSQSQQTCRIVALCQLILNQAFQFIFKHL